MLLSLHIEQYFQYQKRLILDIRSYEKDTQYPIISLILSKAQLENFDCIQQNVSSYIFDCLNITAKQFYDKEHFNRLFFEKSSLYMTDQELVIVHAGMGRIGYYLAKESSSLQGILSISNYTIGNNNTKEV